MSKNKPKTIADLSINWTFDWNTDSGILAKIRETNYPNHSLRIVKNTYSFIIDKLEFVIESINDDTVADLIYHIDAKIFWFQVHEKLPKILTLDRFELIGENEFRIHVKKSSVSQ